MDKKEIKNKIVKILDVENRSLSIREITEKLNLSGSSISQPTALNYLKELEIENKIVEVRKDGKKIQNRRTKSSSKKTNK
jgi:DNA-binding Lrp family transcriptional regulator